MSSQPACQTPFKLSFQLDPAGPRPRQPARRTRPRQDKLSRHPACTCSLTEPRGRSGLRSAELPCASVLRVVCPRESYYPLMHRFSKRRPGRLGRSTTQSWVYRNALFFSKCPKNPLTIGPIRLVQPVATATAQDLCGGRSMYACATPADADHRRLRTQFCAAHALQRFQLLPTVSELKKEPVIAVP